MGPAVESSSGWDDGLLPFLEAVEDRRVPLDPKTVEGVIIRGGRVRCLDDSSLQKEL
ncbi:hypothetical protein ACQPZP_12515 [Spirillospora sp. CA-142024]|uniref:hypothetical protein n=1 Tax=Spirillospora sp. CA-142024 TaxID=3240036 RepID=UPI003D92D64D